MIINNYLTNILLGVGLFKFQYLFFSNFVNPLTAQSLYSTNHSIFFASICSFYKLGWLSRFGFYNLLGISLGETLYDTTLVYSQKDYPMTFHHIFMSLSILFPMLDYYNFINLSNNYIDHLAQVYLCEWSNIFLNYSFMLYKNNSSNTPMFRYINYGLLSSYFLLRICNFTMVEYKLVMQNSYTIAGLMAPVTFLNYYWFYKLIQKSYKLSIENKRL
jgi:hypothetical protein